MRKIFLIALFFVVFGNQALAKTEGFYLGMDAVGTMSKFRPEWIREGQTNYRRQTMSSVHTDYGVGAHAKYAINIKGLFLMPGVFVEQNSFGGGNNKHTYGDRLQINNRYGFKFDVGHDIGWFAPYLTVGYAWVNYKTRTDGYNRSGDITTAVKNGHVDNAFFGGGMKFRVSNNVDIAIEYNYQKFYANTQVPSESTNYISRIRFGTRLDVVKLGMSYKF